MKKIMIFAALSAALLCAAAAPLNIVKRPGLPKWSWDVSKNGELTVDVAGVKYTQSLRYSYPGMKNNAWNTIPGKNVTVSKKGKNAVIALKNAFYTVTMKVTEEKNRLFIQETIANKSGKDLAVAFDMFIRSGAELAPQQILLAGIYKSPSPNSPDSPAQNSTIFFANPEAALGVFLEDDFYRLQVAMKRGENCGIAENRSFGIPADKSYTFEYSIYPMGKGEYYDFVNTLRRYRNANCLLDGNLALATSPHKMLGTQNFPPAIIRSMHKDLGVKYFAVSNGIWLGSTNFYSVPGSRRFMKDYKNLDHYLGIVKQARINAAKISPEIKVWSAIQTVYCAPPQLPGKPVPYEDSVIINANGKPKASPVYEQIAIPGSKKKKRGKLLGTILNYYPMIGNSYYKHLCELIDKAMDAGAQGIYFDTFNYSYWSKYGRWTYDRWDEHTVDMDTKTWTIAKKKAELPVLAAPAQKAMIDHIIKRGGFVIFNQAPGTKEQEKMCHRAMNFTEAQGPALAQTRHLNVPANLGYYPGYRYLEKIWKTPRGIFVNTMENLDWGCLTYLYWPTSRIPANSIARHQFPIKVRNIYAGCVEGEDRIITNRSGVYSLRDAKRPQIFIYDADGVERAPKPEEALFSTENGICIVTLKLPSGGAAVLLKNKAGK